MTNNGPFKKYIIDAVISVKPEIKKDPLTRKSLTESSYTPALVLSTKHSNTSAGAVLKSTG